MARRYVRDKLGRFASHGGGGGSFGGGGKIGKSAKNVKARAAYKNQAGKLREAKKLASGAAKGGDARRSAYANRQLGGAKSGMTRVSNRLTGKGAAKARTGMKKTGSMVPNANKLASSKKFAAARKAPKGSAVRKDAVASAKIRRGERRAKAEIRKGAKARSSYKPKQEAKQAKERILKKTKAKRMEQGVFKTPKGKMSKTKTTAASKAYYKKLSGNARKNFRIGDANRGKSPSEIRGKHEGARGVKKRRGAKVYDNTTNTSIKMKTLKKNLRRKYPESKAAKRLESKVKRGSAATKRDRILRTAKKNVLKSGGIKSAAFDRRVKRLQKAEDIMTKAMGGSTAWKNF